MRTVPLDSAYIEYVGEDSIACGYLLRGHHDKEMFALMINAEIRNHSVKKCTPDKVEHRTVRVLRQILVDCAPGRGAFNITYWEF